jgi:hypothetical protein
MVAPRRHFVVLHPWRGAILPMCTDLTLSPLDIIRICGLRFKIEVSYGGHDATTAREC